MALTTNARAILLSVFIAFGGFLFGYDIGVISGCLIMPDFVERFGEPNGSGGFELSSSRQSIITSLLSAGTFVGALGQALTADRFGRKPSIFIWSAIFTVGTLIQTAALTSLAQLVVGRFIAGLGVGAMSAIVPLYNGETAPKKLRGVLLVLYQFQVIMGIMLSYIIDLATHNIPSSASWKIPVGLQMLWGLILMSGILFLPESPRHLIYHGKEDVARKNIANLNNVPLDDPIVEEEISTLKMGIAAENEGGKVGWLECFSRRNQLWKRTLNGMMLQFIQQLNGQNFYYYYGDTFFKAAGTTMSPYVIQVVLGAVSVAGTFPAFVAIERLGRRKGLLIGAAAEAVCALVAGLAGHYMLAKGNVAAADLTPRNKAGGDILIVFAVLQVFFYSCFWGPLPWVYLGESFPLRVRSKSIALGSATNWFWNFMLSYFSPLITEDIDTLILLVFFGVLVFGFIYVYFMIPESRGLALESIDQMYRENVKPWRSSSWKPHLSEEYEARHPTDVREDYQTEKDKA
ncbi:unnamed protein product [Peniophora sp. CBMAI 1063]|nr:unnamed protein product [Peniophora sp. CBMAI 1063]